MSVYYNEIDPFCAQWLRNLIAAGHLPAGHVDERDIRDVKPYELAPYRQCHFFAGIGGWALALAMADYPSDREVWTGSCPCQPFSQAGKRAGFADERHLWPFWFHLIQQRKPATIFGEQVASADGRLWLSGVRADLEGANYACGACDLCAAAAGAPHQRRRLYWMADSDSARWNARDTQATGVGYGRPIEPSRDRSFWDDFAAHEGDDGSIRRVGSGICAVAHGIPARVGQLRAYGNAIVPQVAAEFVRAWLDTRPDFA